MKVTLNHPSGYVVLRERMNRAAARACTDALFARGQTGAEGTPSITPADIDRATEALAMHLILRAVKIEGPADAPVETEVEVTQAWLDSLDEQDWKTLEGECLKIKNASREHAKK